MGTSKITKICLGFSYHKRQMDRHILWIRVYHNRRCWNGSEFRSRRSRSAKHIVWTLWASWVNVIGGS